MTKSGIDQGSQHDSDGKLRTKKQQHHTIVPLLEEQAVGIVQVLPTGGILQSMLLDEW